MILWPVDGSRSKDMYEYSHGLHMGIRASRHGACEHDALGIRERMRFLPINVTFRCN